MNKLIFSLFCVIGCGSVNQPSSWIIHSPGFTEVVCFTDPSGFARWNRCSSILNGDDKIHCKTSTLLNKGGEIIPDQTKVVVIEHLDNNETKVKFGGKDYYCPVIHLRKS